MNLKHNFQKAKDYIGQRSDTFVGLAVVAVIVIIIATISLIIQLSGPTIVYQPAKACEILTPAEAQNLLGEKVISTDSNEPKISGNIATSKCGYTDTNSNSDQMRIAAIAVRSGINDDGVQQNKKDFASSKAQSTVEVVKGVGESAYFNKANGQLNILSGHNWIILNYGLASSPESNTVDKAIEFAHKIL